MQGIKIEKRDLSL